MRVSGAREAGTALVALLAIAGLVAAGRALGVTNPTIVALSLLIIVLGVAATSTRRLAIATSIAAMAAFNYFFLPPLGTFTIADPENWVALIVFLAVSLVASGLSATVRARTEDAIRREHERDRARRSEEFKSALLASLAHDLKTPLTAIRVAAGNLQANWLSDDQRREQLQIVLAEVSRLSRSFDGILDMARIDAGAVASRREWVHPTEIVDAARALVGPELQQHVIDVEEQGDDLVFVDPRLTSAALAHILENAAAYAPAGSVMTVTTGSTASGLAISVRDRGPGITAADLPHLFERFFRGAAARGVPGTGMGLAIARGLLAVEGGVVSAENHAEGGAVFSLTVPATTRHPLEPVEAAS
jgi:two-component system sensor histidine kinase KdpD